MTDLSRAAPEVTKISVGGNATSTAESPGVKGGRQVQCKSCEYTTNIPSCLARFICPKCGTTMSIKRKPGGGGTPVVPIRAALKAVSAPKVVSAPKLVSAPKVVSTPPPQELDEKDVPKKSSLSSRRKSRVIADDSDDESSKIDLVEDEDVSEKTDKLQSTPGGTKTSKDKEAKEGKKEVKDKPKESAQDAKIKDAKQATVKAQLKPQPGSNSKPKANSTDSKAKTENTEAKATSTTEAKSQANNTESTVKADNAELKTNADSKVKDETTSEVKVDTTDLKEKAGSTESKPKTEVVKIPKIPKLPNAKPNNTAKSNSANTNKPEKTKDNKNLDLKKTDSTKATNTNSTTKSDGTKSGKSEKDTNSGKSEKNTKPMKSDNNANTNTKSTKSDNKTKSTKSNKSDNDSKSTKSENNLKPNTKSDSTKSEKSDAKRETDPDTQKSSKVLEEVEKPGRGKETEAVSSVERYFKGGIFGSIPTIETSTDEDFTNFAVARLKNLLFYSTSYLDHPSRRPSFVRQLIAHAEGKKEESDSFWKILTKNDPCYDELAYSESSAAWLLRRFDMGLWACGLQEIEDPHSLYSPTATVAAAASFLKHLKSGRGLNGPHVVVLPDDDPRSVRLWVNSLRLRAPNLLFVKLMGTEVEEEDALRVPVVGLHSFDVYLTTPRTLQRPSRQPFFASLKSWLTATLYHPNFACGFGCIQALFKLVIPQDRLSPKLANYLIPVDKIADPYKDVLPAVESVFHAVQTQTYLKDWDPQLVEIPLLEGQYSLYRAVMRCPDLAWESIWSKVKTSFTLDEEYVRILWTLNRMQRTCTAPSLLPTDEISLLTPTNPESEVSTQSNKLVFIEKMVATRKFHRLVIVCKSPHVQFLSQHLTSLKIPHGTSTPTTALQQNETISRLFNSERSTMDLCACIVESEALLQAAQLATLRLPSTDSVVVIDRVGDVSDPLKSCGVPRNAIFIRLISAGEPDLYPPPAGTPMNAVSELSRLWPFSNKGSVAQLEQTLDALIKPAALPPAMVMERRPELHPKWVSHSYQRCNKEKDALSQTAWSEAFATLSTTNDSVNGSTESSNSKSSENSQAKDDKRDSKQCFVCHDAEEEGEFPCESCGKYYHRDCVALTKVPDPSENWQCPGHGCLVCGQQITGGSLRCMSCPRSYCFDHWPEAAAPHLEAGWEWIQRSSTISGAEIFEIICAACASTNPVKPPESAPHPATPNKTTPQKKSKEKKRKSGSTSTSKRKSTAEKRKKTTEKATKVIATIVVDDDDDDDEVALSTLASKNKNKEPDVNESKRKRPSTQKKDKETNKRKSEASEKEKDKDEEEEVELPHLKPGDPDDGQEDAFFEVEKIINKTKIKGHYYYRVKWLGYDQSHNSWEPVGSLDATAPDAVREYMARKRSR